MQREQDVTLLRLLARSQYAELSDPVLVTGLYIDFTFGVRPPLFPLLLALTLKPFRPEQHCEDRHQCS